MKLIIDIPEEDYTKTLQGEFAIDVFREAVKKGKPLPKGHGDLIDADKIIKKMEEREEQLKDNRSMYETSCVETALDMFGETIIEADKAESEE